MNLYRGHRVQVLLCSEVFNSSLVCGCASHICPIMLRNFLVVQWWAGTRHGGSVGALPGYHKFQRDPPTARPPSTPLGLRFSGMERRGETTLSRRDDIAENKGFDASPKSKFFPSRAAFDSFKTPMILFVNGQRPLGQARSRVDLGQGKRMDDPIVPPSSWGWTASRLRPAP